MMMMFLDEYNIFIWFLTLLVFQSLETLQIQWIKMIEFRFYSIQEISLNTLLPSIFLLEIRA